MFDKTLAGAFNYIEIGNLIPGDGTADSILLNYKEGKRRGALPGMSNLATSLPRPSVPSAACPRLSETIRTATSVHPVSWFFSRPTSAPKFY